MKDSKIITPYMVGLKDRILETAMTAFAAKGIKAVKMDDIAQMLGISKRTLYEIYYNKECLLYEGVKKFKQIKDEELMTLYQQSPNVIDIVLHVYRKKVEDFNKSCPEFYADMSKYPSVVDFLHEDYQQSHERFIGFLKRGVEEGFFRSGVDLELVSRMFSAISTYIMEHALYKEYSMEQIFQNLVLVSLRGFCTTEGVKLLDQYFDIK